MAAEAPPGLAIVQRFVNTASLDDGTDELATPDELLAWLVDAGLLGADVGPLDDDDLTRARAVREALRAVLLSHHAGERSCGDAMATLNEAARRAPLVVRLDVDGAGLEPCCEGVDAAIGRLLAIVQVAVVDGSWERLKACRLDTCQWAFWDASKNRSGSWCSMAVCGNRSKASAYRARRRSPA